MAGARRWPVPLAALRDGPLPTECEAGAAARDATTRSACTLTTAAKLPTGGCASGNIPSTIILTISLPTSTNTVAITGPNADCLGSDRTDRSFGAYAVRGQPRPRVAASVVVAL
jgi:hypothetical protein